MIEPIDLIPRPRLEAYRKSSLVFGLTGAILFFGILLAFIAQQSWFQQNLTIALVVPNSMGLELGTPVRMSGLRIGLLEHTELLPNGQVKLVLRVPVKYRPWLSPQSVATIKSDGFLSPSYVELKPTAKKTDTAPDKFNVKFTKTPSIEDLLSDAKETQAQLHSLLLSGHEITDKQIPTTLKKANDVMTTSSSLGQLIAREIPRVTESSTSLARSIDQELKPTAQQLRQTLLSVEKTGKSATETSNASHKMLSEIQPELKASVQELQETLSRANKMMQAIQKFTGPLFEVKDNKRNP
jgi:phospholipid/cholesterol/gamma-HCH transport system substrate-binding protein